MTFGVSHTVCNYQPELLCANGGQAIAFVGLGITQLAFPILQDQRRGFENSQNIYSSLSIVRVSWSLWLNSIVMCAILFQASYTSEENYFPESEIYWAPASTKSDLYAQLAQNKFREIPRPLVRFVNIAGNMLEMVVCSVFQFLLEFVSILGRATLVR